ncbi:MAG TPA: TPM domain-containing protein [Bacteroidales bacterium]|nr:TPM domain-containing protein [Bacteroidales bacterium]
MSSAREFFSAQEQEDIRQAIMNAELDTSGEIRIHIEDEVKGDVMDRAAFLFGKLGMTRTELRNGVLIYLAVKNRRFAILGDSGINRVVPDNFWDDVKALMLKHFRENRFTDGLVEAIGASGKLLKKHFPRSQNDVNELPDDISFGQGS